MILHLVCFRFHPGTTDAAIARAAEALLGLRGKIPDIRHIGWGPNQAPSASEYPFVLTVVFDDMAAVQRYTDHPVHQSVVREFLAPIREARFAIDVEAGDRG